MPSWTAALNRATISLSIAILLLLVLLVPLTWNHHTIAQPRSPIQPSPGPPSGVYFDHLVVIMLENEGIYDICGGDPANCNGPNTPYMDSLANSYAVSEQFLSIGHPSQDNYIGVLGALFQNCTLQCAAGSVHATNLVDRFDAAGVSWKAYMENQNINPGCENGDSNGYEIEHNPFVAFANIDNNQTRCANIVRANPALNSTCTVTDCTLINDLNSGPAPSFMWLTPNDCNNMHSDNPPSVCANGCLVDESPTCVEDGDYYLQTLVPNILRSNTFEQTRSALFIGFDEGNGFCAFNNKVGEDCMYTVWAGPQAKDGYTTTVLYNQYSLTKTIETNWNLPTLTTNDAGASSMAEFFHTSQPDYSISASPTLLVTPAGLNTSSTITVNSLNNYTGTVNLTATLFQPSTPVGGGGGGTRMLVMSPLSTGINLPVFPNSRSILKGGSGQYVFAVPFSANSQAADSRIVVAATDGNISHSIGLTLEVVDFALSSPASFVKLAGGANTTLTLGVSSSNFFRGTISLVTSVSPSGPLSSLNPSSVQLSPLGNSTVLTILVPSSTRLGTYSLIVQASSVTFSRSLIIAIIVTSGSTTVLVKLINSNPLLVGLVSLASTLALVPIRSVSRLYAKHSRVHYSRINAPSRIQIQTTAMRPFWLVQHDSNGPPD